MENEKSGRPKGSLSLRQFRCAERRWRASPLRSTAAGIGGVRSRVDSQDTLLQQRVINQENKGHWVTPLLAQRYPLPGNGALGAWCVTSAWVCATLQGSRRCKLALMSPSEPSKAGELAKDKSFV